MEVLVHGSLNSGMQIHVCTVHDAQQEECTGVDASLLVCSVVLDLTLSAPAAPQAVFESERRSCMLLPV